MYVPVLMLANVRMCEGDSVVTLLSAYKLHIHTPANLYLGTHVNDR